MKIPVRSWMQKLSRPASARPVRLMLTCLEGRDVPAVVLPTGFVATSGLYGFGEDVLAGSYQDKPAVVRVSSSVAGSIEILPSLSVANSGGMQAVNTSGLDPARGLIRDIVMQNGQLIYVGRSQSFDSDPFNDGEATSWSGGTVQGFGFFGNSQRSELFAAASNRFVGVSSATPVFWSGTTVDQLSATYEARAIDISADGKYIVGVDGTLGAAWKWNTATNVYDKVVLQAPTAGGPLGYMVSVVGNLAVGQFYDPVTVVTAGGMWNLDTGSMVYSFGSFGGVGVEAQFEQVGKEKVAIFSSSEGQQPLVVVIDEFGVMRSFSMFNLNGANFTSEVTDLYARPNGSIGVTYIATDGRYYASSFLTNDRGEPWGGTPNQAPGNLQLSNATIAENRAAGAIVGTLSATDPEGDAIAYSIQTTGTPFQIVNNALVATSSLNFETTATYSLRVRATDAQGAFAERDFVVNVLDVVELVGISVNNGQVGRSNINAIRVTFDSNANAQAIKTAGAIRIRRDGLTSNLQVPVTRIAVDGNSLVFDLRGLTAFAVNDRYFV
jgi:hypothetical protein